MNGNASGATGLESADTSSAADHPAGVRRSALDLVFAAQEALCGCNKQEAQEARELLAEAISQLS